MSEYTPTLSNAPSDSALSTLNGPLQRKESYFEKAADTAYQAVLAISRGDESAARNEIDKLRLLRSILSVGEASEPVASGVDGASPLSLQRMRCAVDAIQASQDVISQWIHNHAANLAEAGELDALGWQRKIDVDLPGAWNFEADVLLVYGRVHSGLLAALRERGQRRVLFIVHPDEDDSGDECPAASDLRVVRTESDIGQYLEGLKTPFPKHIARMDIGQGDSLRPEDFGAFVHKSIMGIWMSVNTRRHFAQHWVEQGIANMPALARHHNLRELDGAFRGRPAILIAPGPSLDKNIAQLKAAQGKAVLIAPLQTLRRLYKAGIQPDFVLVLDATDLTTDPYDFFNEVPSEFLTSLIVGVNCHPNVVKKFQSVYFFSASGPLDHWLEDMLGDQPLVNLEAASVALSGLLLAQHWGCNPIVLTGQDLALADGGQRYAQDAQLNNLSEPKLMTLPGYHGGTVKTPTDYYLFHHQFEQIAQRVGTSHPDVRLYNCTEGGAYIQGYEHLPLQQVLSEHVLSAPPTNWVAVQHAHYSLTRQQQRTAAAKIHLDTVRKAVDASERQADKCRRLTLRPNASAAYLRQLDTEEKQLRRLIGSIKGFSIVFQDQIDAALQAAANARSLQANLAASRELYAVVLQGCAFIRPLVIRAQAELAQAGDGGSAPAAADAEPHQRADPLVQVA